jgi:hypothetical protein
MNISLRKPKPAVLRSLDDGDLTEARGAAEHKRNIFATIASLSLFAALLLLFVRDQDWAMSYILGLGGIFLSTLSFTLTYNRKIHRYDREDTRRAKKYFRSLNAAVDTVDETDIIPSRRH